MKTGVFIFVNLFQVPFCNLRKFAFCCSFFSLLILCLRGTKFNAETVIFNQIGLKNRVNCAGLASGN